MGSKHKEETPSTITSKLHSKAQILSELNETRNIIKNKFRKAYTNRMTRERNLRETVKPIISEIGTSKSGTIETKIKTEPRGLPILSALRRLHETKQRETPENVSPGEFFSAKTTRTDKMKADPNQFHYNEPSTSKPIETLSGLPKAQKNPNLSIVRRKLNFTPSLDDLPEHESIKVKPKVSTARARILPDSLSGISSRTRKQIIEGQPIGSRTRLKSMSKARTGKGLKSHANHVDFNFIPYSKNDHIIYEYFDDPNELCERLRLLVSSRMAGNTNHMQEINSIVEELRELEYIT